MSCGVFLALLDCFLEPLHDVRVLYFLSMPINVHEKNDERFILGADCVKFDCKVDLR